MAILAFANARALAAFASTAEGLHDNARDDNDLTTAARFAEIADYAHGVPKDEAFPAWVLLASDDLPAVRDVIQDVVDNGITNASGDDLTNADGALPGELTIVF